MGTALAQGLRTTEGTKGKPTGEPASWLRTRCLQLPQPAIPALTARSPLRPYAKIKQALFCFHGFDQLLYCSKEHKECVTPPAQVYRFVCF